MKNVFLILLMFLSFSCKKEEPGYVLTPEKTQGDSDDWRNGYVYSGTLPNNNTNVNNALSGTKWVLTKYVTAFATQSPNDTIHFISNIKYTLNNGGTRSYVLSKLPSSTNYDLQLDYFMPFGGSLYGGQVGFYFVEDGEMNNILFTDLMNKNITIKAWFIRIK